MARWPDFIAVTVPFDEIIDYVAAGDADAGLIIHEGQLTFGDAGLHLTISVSGGRAKWAVCRCRSAAM